MDVSMQRENSPKIQLWNSVTTLSGRCGGIAVLRLGDGVREAELHSVPHGLC